MAFNLKKWVKGIIIDTLAYDSTVHDKSGATFIDSADDKITSRLGGAQHKVLTEAQTATLTNKTFDAEGTGNSLSNIDDANIKAAAGIDATKLADGSVTDTELQYINTLSSNAQDQIDSKSNSGDLTSHEGDTSTHGVSTIVGTTEAQALTNKTVDSDLNTVSNIEDANIKAAAGITASKLADGSVDNAEFQRLNGVTSGIQSQIDNKEAADATILKEADIVDTLVSTSVVDPLSANQGKTLKDNSDTHISDTSTHGVSGDILGTSDTQSVSNKTYDATNLHSDSVTVAEQGSTPATPAATEAKLYPKAFGAGVKWYSLDDQDVEVELGSGAGSGKKNYVTNGDFDNDITGTTSSDGTNLAISQETVAPLSGDGSLKIVANGSQSADVKVTIDLDTYDITDQHSVIQNELAYTYDGPEDTVLIGLYDNTNTKLIQGSLSYLKAGTFANHISFVQSSPDSVDYSLVVQDTVGGSSYTILMDRVVVTPDVVGGNSSEGVMFQGISSINQVGQTGTTTIVFGDATGTSGMAVDNYGGYNPTNGVYTFTKNFKGLVGGGIHGTTLLDGSLYQTTIVKNLSGSNEVVSNVRHRGQSSGAQMFHSPLKYAEFSRGDTVEFRFGDGGGTASIGGNERDYFTLIESASGGSSSQGGEILSKVEYNGSDGLSKTFNTTDISFLTSVDDNLGEWDGSGFTPKSAGRFVIMGDFRITSSTALELKQYTNGSQYSGAYRVNTSDAASLSHGFHAIINLDAGQRWSLRSDTTVTQSAATRSGITIARLAETSNGIVPSQVRLFERYTTDAGQSLASGNNLIYEDAVAGNTHNQYDITTGIFTAPWTGVFFFHMHTNINFSPTPAGGSFFNIRYLNISGSLVLHALAMSKNQIVAQNDNNVRRNIFVAAHMTKGSLQRFNIQENIGGTIINDGGGAVAYFEVWSH